jgi:hypothetical protein
MSLPQIKRDFIKKLVGGLNSVMEITQLANRIGIAPRNDNEIFIKKHFLIQSDDGSFQVHKVRFRMGLTALDFDTLTEILICLDKNDVTLSKVYDKSTVDVLSLNGEEMNYIQLIKSGDLVTFMDLILY